MNKKVLTLCAGFLLAGSLTATAQETNWIPVSADQLVSGANYRILDSRGLPLVDGQSTVNEGKMGWAAAAPILDSDKADADSIWTLTKGEAGFTLKSTTSGNYPIALIEGNGTGAAYQLYTNQVGSVSLKLNADGTLSEAKAKGLVHSYSGLYFDEDTATATKFTFLMQQPELTTENIANGSDILTNVSGLVYIVQNEQYVGVETKEVAETRAISTNYQIVSKSKEEFEALSDDEKLAYSWTKVGDALENVAYAVYLDANTESELVLSDTPENIDINETGNILTTGNGSVAITLLSAQFGAPFETAPGYVANTDVDATRIALVVDGKVVATDEEGNITFLDEYDANDAVHTLWTLTVDEKTKGDYILTLVNNGTTLETENGVVYIEDVDFEYDEKGNVKSYALPTGGELTLRSYTATGDKYVAFDGTSLIEVDRINESDTFGAGQEQKGYVTAETLLQRYSEYFTFDITYKYKDQYGNDAEVDLTEIFEGELTPIEWTYYSGGNTWYRKAAPTAEHFMLINEDEKILALDTKDLWSIGNNNHAYNLKLISPAEYAADITPNGAHKYQVYFTFEYTPGTEASEVTTQITNVYVGTENNWPANYIGCYLDNGKTPELAGATYGSLAEVVFELNAAGTVTASKWLTTPSYYKVEVINKDKESAHYGKVLSLNENGTIGYVASTQANLNMPESQFAITYDEDNDRYVFTNRETGKSNNDNYNGDDFVLNGADLYNTGEDNVFAYRHVTDWATGHMDTLKITPVTKYTSADGFRRYSAADLNANTYNVALNTIAGPLYIIENHNDKHRIGLDAEEATAWRIEIPTVKVLNVVGDFDRYAADTVTVTTAIKYYANNKWNWTQLTNPKADTYAPNTRLEICTYVLKNTATDEYFDGKDYTEEVGNAYYVCNEDEKTATRLALKLAGDSTIALVPVYNYADYQPWGWATGMEVNETSYDSYAEGLQLSGNKVIGGTTADAGVLKDVNRFSATSNDLFVIEETGARTYKLLNQDDKVIISLMENNDEVIYEDGAFANIDNRLAYDINPTLYVDTAYINRPGNYRYDYLLSVRPFRVDSIEECNNPNHEHPRTTFTEGDFLVVMRDSMEANKDVHNNIYAYNEQPRLAFVPGIHQNDTLYYTNAAGEIIAKEEVGNAKYSFAKFAFKMINEVNNEFVIETAYDYTPVKWVNGEPVEYEVSKGYLRWDNSFLVVTPNLDDAEHFTMEASELNATSNEEISAENAAVSVVATDGAVVIKGAEGKNVVIATILGKVVANETINSDNETIAVPAGIAVVSVDGESFKVVVK